jgi:hypothetical protein
MGIETRGRPRAEGERYPSGKLKPARPAAAAPSAAEPISGALWQRMLNDHSKVFGDAAFATELTRLGATKELTPREIAVGLRIAGIYGRFEYYQHLSRSAASPHYIREFVAESGAFGESGGTIDTDKEIARALEVDDREEREREATRAFKELQGLIPKSLRSEVEALCVENLYIGHQKLLAVRAALALVSDGLPDKTTGLSRRKRRALRKRVRPSLPEPTKAKPIKVNTLKDAFLQLQRRLSPHLADEELEQAWNVFCALKAREDFRQEKSEGGHNASAR